LQGTDREHGRQANSAQQQGKEALLAERYLH
jgi:hypothetical protein